MGIHLRKSNGQIAKGNNLRHGLSKSPIYDCWVAMKARCNNKNHPHYKNYGGRGISVCDRWMNSFDNFLFDMGHRPSIRHTIDRINNDGNYEPSNCRWITIQDQQKNRCNNNFFPGVVYEKSRKKWRSDITRGGNKYFLGRYVTFEDAKKARLEAEIKYNVY